MASAFSHILVPAVIYGTFRSKTVNFKLFFLGAVLSILPDIDVIGFFYGIPYESQWGHRGFTHSFVFALAIAVFLSLFYRQLDSRPWTVIWVSFVSCASHAMLDGMTNGGLGVALYWPFSLERVFLPFTPIVVSPIGIGSFFSEWGLRVIVSELIWVFIPALILGAMGMLYRRIYVKNRVSE